MIIEIKESCDRFWPCLEPADWISLIAVVIAMIAAIASWRAIYSQEKINKKNQEPIIVPGIKSIEANISHILSDWDQNERIPEKFSNTKLPIWNYGNTPVFNIGYCYYIDNIEDFMDEYKDNTDTDEFNVKDYMGHNIYLDKEENNYILSVIYDTGSKLFKIAPYIRTIDVIKPNENTDILLPDYFIVMLNNHFIQMNAMLKYGKVPILKLKIFYDDTNFQTWEQEFRIFVSTTYHFNGVNLTTSFHYEAILPKQKHKRLTVGENEKNMMKRKSKQKTFGNKSN